MAWLKNHPDSADAHAVAADLRPALWLVHHFPKQEAKAKEHLAAAESGNSRLEERYATHARHLIAAGKSAEAEKYVEGLRQQGANTARLWNVQGLAFQTQGNFLLARQAFSQAVEKAWKDPRYTASFGSLSWPKVRPLPPSRP